MTESLGFGPGWPSSVRKLGSALAGPPVRTRKRSHQPRTRIVDSFTGRPLIEPRPRASCADAFRPLADVEALGLRSQSARLANGRCSRHAKSEVLVVYKRTLAASAVTRLPRSVDLFRAGLLAAPSAGSQTRPDLGGVPGFAEAHFFSAQAASPGGGPVSERNLSTSLRVMPPSELASLNGRFVWPVVPIPQVAIGATRRRGIWFRRCG